MEKIERRQLLRILNNVSSRQEALVTPWGPGVHPHEIKPLAEMAVALRDELEGVNALFTAAGLENPVHELSVTGYPDNRKPQQTVVSFAIGPQTFKIAAVLDDVKRKVYRGLGSESEKLLENAHPFGAAYSVKQAVIQYAAEMLGHDEQTQLISSITTSSSPFISRGHP